MRITPRPAIPVVLFVAYIVLVFICWRVFGIDYQTVDSTADSIVKGIIVTIGLGALLLAAAATWLGWWRPALVEDRPAGPRWLLVLPALWVVIALLNAAAINGGSPNVSLLPLVAVGVLLVGFSEEMLTRGLMLVGLRAGLAEGWVWLVSSALFGLLHALNALFGQALPATLIQIATAFVAGTTLYASRRITGGLLAPMGMHALWDFASLGIAATGGAPPVTALLQYPMYALGFVAVWLMLRRPRTETGLASAGSALSRS